MVESFTTQLSFWSADEAESAWIVRESQRARRLSVRVFRTGKVEVVVPRRTSQRTIQRFLDEHQAWIERKRAEAHRDALPMQPFPPQRIELVAARESWRVHPTGGAGRARIRVLAPGILGLSGNAEPRAVRAAMQGWLTERAREILTASLAIAARESGLSYSKVTLRRQRTRWGSCSTRGTISLNCCLLFQRPQVVRYLLIHELAHTLHMNHSKRFWQCVARHCPDFKNLDWELREGWRHVPPWVLER